MGFIGGNLPRTCSTSIQAEPASTWCNVHVTAHDRCLRIPNAPRLWSFGVISIWGRLHGDDTVFVREIGRILLNRRKLTAYYNCRWERSVLRTYVLDVLDAKAPSSCVFFLILSNVSVPIRNNMTTGWDNWRGFTLLGHNSDSTEETREATLMSTGWWLISDYQKEYKCACWEKKIFHTIWTVKCIHYKKLNAWGSGKARRNNEILRNS